MIFIVHVCVKDSKHKDLFKQWKILTNKILKDLHVLKLRFYLFRTLIIFKFIFLCVKNQTDEQLNLN